MTTVERSAFVPFHRKLAVTGSVALAFLISGCNKTISDAQLTSDVQAALKRDAAISQQPVQVSAQNGVVTLSGNVSDDTASTVAAQDAARVKGVKEVIDSINVAGMQTPPTVTSPAAPTQPRQTTEQERQTIAQSHTLPAPKEVPTAPAVTKAQPPAPPPAPAYHDVTAPAGTVIPFRITESLSSNHSEDGESFNGTITSNVTHNGYVIIPAGSAASGHVIDAKDAGRFKGHSALSVELTAVRRNGSLVNISTEPYTVEGKNRGKNSAVKIGGGAAVGAVLGGIFGGGKGAGIGALAGGGAGTAYQGLTHGQQVSIPSETAIRFRLSSPLTVRTSDTSRDADGSGLRERER